MKVELQVKYAKPKEALNPFRKLTAEEKYERDTKRIIGNDDEEDEIEFRTENKVMKLFDPSNLDFYYRPHVIDTKNVEEFWSYDDDHVMIIENNASLLAKVKWEDWKVFWEKITGETIYIIN